MDGIQQKSQFHDFSHFLHNSRVQNGHAEQQKCHPDKTNKQAKQMSQNVNIYDSPYFMIAPLRRTDGIQQKSQFEDFSHFLRNLVCMLIRNMSWLSRNIIFLPFGE